VAPRASRTAESTASVPELTSRTRSTGGILSRISSARSSSPSVGAPKENPRRAAAVTASTTAGCAWPRIIGPQELTRSTYRRPSASVIQGPEPSAMKRGVPPTARNARTGLFTPPGVTSCARAKRSADTGAS
jgi:hypothetical protein